MTYKNIKFEDSPVMRSLEKLAVNKGLVKPENITKTAKSKELSLKPTENLEENILKLCSALRASGFDKHAVEVETKFFNLKRAQAYDVHKETGEDLVNAAHPDGSHQMKDVAGDAVVETVIDVQKAMQKMVAKQPTGKQATRGLAELVKNAGKLDKKDAINAVKVVLADDTIQLSDPVTDDGETATAYSVSSLLSRAVFLLGQETVTRMNKDIMPLMSLDKIPAPVKQGVNTYKQFLTNVAQTLIDSLSEAYKQAKDLETKRLAASGNDHNASKINIKEIMPYLTKGKAANLGLAGAANFAELRAKLNEIYSKLGEALETKLLPAFNQPPFDSGDLKGVGDKIKASLNETINTLKKG